MLWAIGGMVVGAILGAGVLYLYISHKFTSAMGQAFGYPSRKQWWKFWK